MYAVLLDYADVFTDDAGDLGKTDKLQHTINTGCALPVRQAAQRLPAAQCHVEVQKLHAKRNGGEENYPALKEHLGITSCACQEEGWLHPILRRLQETKFGYT